MMEGAAFHKPVLVSAGITQESDCNEINQQSKEFMPHAVSKIDQVVHAKEQTNKL